ncbi:MAG: ribonuclease P protein component [Erysipelotrichaceae bacterium]|nr:ribonuclease P protein component [Erysipelotrichaceae bacterium]
MNKQYRVKKSNEIEKILKEKKFSSNSYFSVYKRNNPETSHFRYAISVGKKLGNAVIRNKLKRQIRAVINELNIDLNRNTDVFIIAKVKILDISYQEMLKQLEYLFNKQKLIKGEKND